VHKILLAELYAKRNEFISLETLLPKIVRFSKVLEWHGAGPMSRVYKLVDKNGQTFLSRKPGKFGGHRKLKIYGRLDCPSALRFIARGHYVQHRVFFADEATAVAAGYRPLRRLHEGGVQSMEARRLIDLLSRYRFHHQDEKELQLAISQIFRQNDIGYRSEVILTPKDRIDFLVEKVGVEVKVEGALAAVTRQLFRYAERPEIDELVLLTTRQAHRNMPDQILGKPLYVIWVNVFL
jgi:hypothetical protein